ncbi:uncharacterized protein LOC135710016 [Ochlerotatus camptorhynchus]|uniref:uncharacterized protein LOC135710016 n=1 Tax=Ochlerotatus camptorhynchus TaxID=644619 RepID=UPI0031CEB756
MVKTRPFSSLQPAQESTDDEEAGYETDEYFDEQGRKVVEIDYSKVDYVGPIVRPPRPPKKKRRQRNVALDEIRYTMDDMTPIIRDPRCNSNTDLACFWPVYVGNFKDTSVSQYFASRGLYVRWWYHRKDEYYREFQCKAQIFDMLVYFVSERDAKLAIERCHRDTHRGYTLNVFPGREPVYFKEDRSVYAEKMKSGRIFSEQFFEKHAKFICKVKVNCVVKFDMKHGALEFERPEDVLKAQKKERMWKYAPITWKLQKQRFLENDVLNQIEAFLVENPDTLKVKRNDKYMKLLLNGFRPFIDEGRQYRVVPLRQGPSKKTQMKLFQKKMKRKYGMDAK